MSLKENVIMNITKYILMPEKVISIMNTHLSYAHSKYRSLNHKTNHLHARLSKKLNFERKYFPLFTMLMGFCSHKKRRSGIDGWWSEILYEVKIHKRKIKLRSFLYCFTNFILNHQNELYALKWVKENQNYFFI